MRLVILGIVAAVATACTGKPNVSLAKADETERAILGRAAPYPADTLHAEALNAKVRDRREAAWRAIEKALAPVSVTLDGGRKVEVPTFLTWYESEEMRSLATDLYRTHGRETGGRPGFAPDIIETALAQHFRSKQALTPETFKARGAGKSGGVLSPRDSFAPTLFSEGFFRHYLEFANSIIGCDLTSTRDLVAEKAAGTVESFSPCMAREFPRDSVMIKSRWKKVEADGSVATQAFPTDAKTLQRLLGKAMEKGGNDQNAVMQGVDVTVDARRDGMLVVEDRDGGRWALEALHVSTKEVDEWLWTTIWFSTTPQLDFGADRPASLASVIPGYKMCAQTTFLENDTTFDGLPETLAAALRATTLPDGRMANEQGIAGFCANPYIEGFFPTKTCIGCHQDAATGGFQEAFRTRNNFPADFSWGFTGFRLILENARRVLAP